MYSYGDSSWLDLLTAYDGQSISYDSIGNPTSWYDGTTFTWSNGRRLTSAVNSSTGLNNSYTYDMDGLRLTKTVGSVEHKYVWQGSKLVAEYFGGTELEFFYDENGSPYAFSYKATASATPVMYYYVTNLQGDVVSILNASGTSVAEYSYNAWGKVLSATGTMAAINPIRYRGYYFDYDSGLYYLKSRYYDPNLQRFINSDDVVSTGQGFIGTNTFAYCLNNPLIYVDVDGNDPISIAIALVTIGEGFSLALGGTTAYYSNVTATFNFPKLSVSIEREYYKQKEEITLKYEVCKTTLGLLYDKVSTWFAKRNKNNPFEEPNITRVGRQNGKTPRNNRNQNSQITTIANMLKLTDDERRRLHYAVTHQGFDFKEILEIAIDMFGWR